MDVDEYEWQRSSRCASSSCVEVASRADRVYVRDSKHPEQQPLEFERDTWRAFVEHLKRS